ncbi:Metalloendopeptidase [Aphelenchoides besseyi]|nr:Metalloendopeptidase [Aphelenchoides besseyi]
MRNALPTNSLNRWSEYRDRTKNFVIPFIITGEFDAEENSIILAAMRALERNTCIRFKKREDERDYVDIKNEHDEGCYTSVGRSRGKNIVMLEANSFATCIEHDVYCHSRANAYYRIMASCLAHSCVFNTRVGLKLHNLRDTFSSITLIKLYAKAAYSRETDFRHEHQRYDRDDFITVRYDKIEPAFFSQFEKISRVESTVYNVEYDYKSIMHYSRDSFAAIPGDTTMETKNPNYQEIIGKTTDASPSDYIKICNIYKCGICMGQPFKKEDIPSILASTSEPPFSRRFTTPSRPRSTHRPTRKPRECEDSFFCPKLLTTNGSTACDTLRLKRWCCASCSSQSSN